MSRPRRVTPRFPSIIHQAAAASAPVFNSPDDHIIPPPKRDGQLQGRREMARERKKIKNEVEEEERGKKAPERHSEIERFPSICFAFNTLCHTNCSLFLKKNLNFDTINPVKTLL